MRKTRPFLLLLSLTLALGLATGATAGSGVSVGGGLMLPLSYPVYPNSTFRVVDENPYAYGYQVGEQVRLLLTLEFPTPGVLVESFSNRIEWQSGDLNLISVLPAEGSPAVQVNLEQGTGYATWTYTVGATLVAQPLLVLTFETTCSGFGESVPVNFVESDQNAFVNGGVNYRAATLVGETIPLSEDIYAYMGAWASGYPGGPDIPYDVLLDNSVPGAASRVEIEFDPGLVSVTGVTSLVEGATFDWQVSPPGLLVVTSSSVLENTRRDIFQVAFHLLTPGEAYDVALAWGAGTVFTTECGLPGTAWNGLAGGIHVPAYAVTADVAEVSYPTTATQYDVSFVWTGTMPTTDYELWVQYPATQLNFLGPVAVAGYAVPWAGADGGMIQIEPYVSDTVPALESPTTVFKLRFSPKQTFPSGTVFNLSFVQPTETYASYAALGSTLPAALTKLNGSITLTGGGGGPGCPGLYVWDGTQYRLENNLLAACDGVRHEQDVTEHYLLTDRLQPRDGELRLQISERDDEVTTLSGLTLLAIDHPARRPIQIGTDGRIVELRQPLALKSARDHTGRDITALLAARDQIAYVSDEPGWLEVNYGTLLDSQLPREEVAGIGDPPPKDLEKAGEPANKLRVLVKSPEGWQLVEQIDARVRPQPAPVMIQPEAFAAGREVILRYEWTGSYRVDFAELVMTSPFDGPIARPGLLRAEHSTTGDVRNALAGTAEPVVLNPGQTIELAFAAGTEPSGDSGTVRDYVVVVTGRYENGAGTPQPEVLSFGLGLASPNPFNPKTEIAYSLDRSGPVSLAIYDARGARVRTLVSETQAAGAQRTTWDGRDDTGRRVASGTYFCRLVSGERQQMQKLLLLK